MSADCRLTLTVREARDAEEIAAAQRLRVRVFCEEQGVPVEAELDPLDAEALQIVGLDESGVVATCRLRFLEDMPRREAEDMSKVRFCKLERMAVDKRLRGLGGGGKLLETADEIAREHRAEQILVHAQRRAEGFYVAHGYRPEGETFMEAEIPHVRMVKPL